MLSKKKSDTYSLTLNGSIVGKVRLLPAGNGGWYLAGFMIYSRFRGRGYGHELMRAVLKFARRKRKKTIFLWVRADNTAAIRIYEKHGFKRLVNDTVCMYLLKC